MVLKAYSIYDVKSASFGVPWFMGTDNEAVRLFGDLVNDERSKVHKHPEDYQLFSVGEFTDDSAALTSWVPKHVVNAAAMLKVKSQLSLPEGLLPQLAANVVKFDVNGKEQVKEEVAS